MKLSRDDGFRVLRCTSCGDTFPVESEEVRCPSCGATEVEETTEPLL